MSTFVELYGDLLDRELGTADRTQRFTTVRRKAAINEGQRRFNELTGCFVRRGAIALTDEVASYDLNDAAVMTSGDYIRPSETSASIRRVGATTTEYTEGSEFPFKSEEELNQIDPGWRAWAPGTPIAWTLVDGGASHSAVLVPAPSIPATETWSLMLPYVAVPPDMSADDDEPYTLSGNVKKNLRPFHDGLLAYAAAQLEKFRKDVDAYDRQMRIFTTFVALYNNKKRPMHGRSIRLAVDYRARLRHKRVTDPTR